MNESTPPPVVPHAPSRPRIRLERQWWVPMCVGALVGIAIRLIYSGRAGEPYDAMMGSFTIFAPISVAVVTVYVAERIAPREWWYYVTSAALANALFVFGTLLIMIEGLICAIVAVPLFAVIGGIAGLITGAIFRLTRWPRRAVHSIVAVPLLLGAVEQYLPLPDNVRTVETSRLIAAPASSVWPQLLDASRIQSNEIGAAWMYRIGVPLPLSAVTQRQGDELVRHIRMGKNVHFDQIATDWQINRRVHWTYHFDADSFPAGALDDHVRIGGEHFDVLDTTYTLNETPSGTRLTVQMRYRVSTRFNWYSQSVAELMVRNFEATALAFYAHRAEHAAALKAT
jgi:hypothetical protein